MNFEMSNVKDNNEVLSQQLSEAKSKFNTLEIELQSKRDALRQKTLALEHLQGNLKQTQDQKMEIEQKSQNEQDKVNKYVGKHESLEERLSQPQSENTLLREQLDDGYSRVECKEKTRIDLKDQVQVIVRTLQAETEKQSLLLQERNKELINEWKHLIERIYTYKKEKEGREASLELSHCCTKLEDEIQDLKKICNQIKRQVQEAEDQHTKIVRCIEKSRAYEKKLEVENAKLKVTIKEQAGEIEQLQKDLLSTSSCGDEKESLKKCMELKQSLQFRLDQEVKKNEELEKENTGESLTETKGLKLQLHSRADGEPERPPAPPAASPDSGPHPPAAPEAARQRTRRRSRAAALGTVLYLVQQEGKPAQRTAATAAESPLPSSPPADPPHLDLPTPLSPMLRTFRVVSTSPSILTLLRSEPSQPPGAGSQPFPRARWPRMRSAAHLKPSFYPGCLGCTSAGLPGSALRKLRICANSESPASLRSD
ncbi:ankyrin repeat domain-containing protein 26-like [Vulpes lagopus]|uniref:ankyrin repeat domain-containing protein 26-like n=1 Tax=Vulpes lagopus TaxID=494514 RepID=UPI001BC92550|nr:ankyrin repeat domain-containing protein 26-like [Vulpes lagopus]